MRYYLKYIHETFKTIYYNSVTLFEIKTVKPL